ncbi:MAG TPA: DUF4398 domain-containing protein [Polyangiaceae bacterium]|nr:DUF4398 domain-containing protein [Polyangiaceae bacterium]
MPKSGVALTLSPLRGLPMRIAMIAVLLGMSLSACGGSLPPPNDEWAAAQADVGRAEAGGAPDVPDAKLHLQLAQENLQKSKALIDDDNSRAASLIAVARVEAQLALSLAKAQQATDQAHQAQTDLQKAKGSGS